MAGKKPLYKCLKRFEVRVPVKKVGNLDRKKRSSSLKSWLINRTRPTHHTTIGICLVVSLFLRSWGELSTLP